MNPQEIHIEYAATLKIFLISSNAGWPRYFKTVNVGPPYHPSLIKIEKLVLSLLRWPKNFNIFGLWEANREIGSKLS